MNIFQMQFASKSDGRLVGWKKHHQKRFLAGNLVSDNAG